jgi:flagellar biosynthetic protein FliO
LEKNKRSNRNRLVAVGVILAVAMCGLFLIAGDGVDATPNGQSSVGALTGDGLGASPTQSALGSVLKMLSALVLVIIAIYGGMYFLGKIIGKPRGRRLGTHLDVLETAFVGPKKSVSLVRVADRSVLVGVTENNISVLTELDQDETARIIEAQDVPASDSFGNSLTAALGKVKQFRLKPREAVSQG